LFYLYETKSFPIVLAPGANRGEKLSLTIASFFKAKAKFQFMKQIPECILSLILEK